MKDNKLLVIELENEDAVPKVFYKGEEITDKVHVGFDWSTQTDKPHDGGLTYSIKHVDRNGSYPASNLIERRINGHVFD
jgi:hypothetical protein